MTKMFNKSYSYSSISDKGCRSRGCCGSACCSGGCGKCMTRIPYATLIATILCCTGVGIFLGSFYRAIALTLSVFQDVFKFKFYWLSDLHIIFIGIGAAMGGLALILLLVGFLATGSTRQKVYRGWKSRVGGRITCGIFMAITYILEIVWIAVMICLVVITFVFAMFWGMCNNLKKGQCIDLRQFKFMTTPNTNVDDLELCEGKLKNFCTDCVEESGILFLLALASSILVVISLVNYLMCLAANYARIKDNEKFQDLQELQYLHETEMETLPKDRF